MHPEGTLLPQSFNSYGEGLEISPGFDELTLLLNEHVQVLNFRDRLFQRRRNLSGNFFFIFYNCQLGLGLFFSIDFFSCIIHSKLLLPVDLFWHLARLFT